MSEGLGMPEARHERKRAARYTPDSIATPDLIDAEHMSEMPELIPLEAYPPYLFSCGADEQQEFLLERAVPEQEEELSRTYLAQLHGMVVGYFTLAMDAIELEASVPRPAAMPTRRLPAIRLVHLAVDDQWERRGIGKMLVAAAIAAALETRAQVGCRYLTLDARTPSLATWFARQGFVVNGVDETARRALAAERGIDVAAIPASMRLDLQHLVADLTADLAESDAEE
jgi:GNAT superfamily N-acetyltransferase